ncbi:hypothetical protein CBR_g40813 [Chara braunii]|uniref:SGNH hydrolase-type esterase domain-containing protein n=1 Tax=Chara braunii TaxID=69332 RepID=A0A388LUK5_CHABU|nr:hypothetical protein CBR_g40813 [Chara braunii]|eukprot:GBG86000.1 hypothetical protein CBR_g40813 [Chara braunii]
MAESAAAADPREMSKRIISFPRPKIILFGDSLTEWAFQRTGWGALLADRYARKADVVNRGYSGYNTCWALHLLDKLFPKKDTSSPPPPLGPPQPREMVTVFFGANDAVVENGAAAKHHVPLEEYRQNLSTIVQHLQKVSKSTFVVLIAPPPVDSVAHLNHCRRELGTDLDDCGRSNESVGLYAEACVQVGREMGVPVIDLWKMMQEGGGDWKRYLCDGLHFSEEGNAFVFDALMRVVEEHGRSGEESLVAEEMPMDYPSFEDIDPITYAQMFAAWMEKHHY